MTSASTSFSTFTYGRSLDGEVTSISSSYQNANAPATLISNVNNGPFGPVTYSYGNGLSQDYYYDALGRQSAGWVCPQTPSDGCSGNPYGYSIGIKGSQVPVTYDNFTGQNSRYTYDEFNRLTGTNYGNGAQTFSYTYDRYGNRWSQNAPQGGPAPSFSFNTANNRIVGMQYDAAGNLTSDGIHTYAYDAEGNQTNVDNYNTAQYVYDALNHRVWSHTAGNSSAEQPVYAEIEYDANGRRSSIWDGAARSLMQVEVYWDGTPFAFYKDGVIHFQHKDWTGSERMRTGATGAVEMTTANYPFGESISVSGKDIDTAHFAQLDHDMESGNEDATYRKLSSRHGRWMSPDPYDGSYDAGNPQSFNRYAYVLNNPVAYTDPSGQDPCNESDGCYSVTTTLDCWFCEEYGGSGYSANEWGVGPGTTPYSPPTNTPPAAPPAATPTAPSSGTPPTACQVKVLNAVNNQFGVNGIILPSSNPLPTPDGGQVNVNIGIVYGLSASQFNGIQAGRYFHPTGLLGALTGYGSSLHVVGTTNGLDPTADSFANSNIGGMYSVSFTAHTDSAWAYNPIGALLHYIIDLVGHGSRDPCP